LDEDRQTGLVQTVPAGGVVGVVVMVGDAVAVGVGGAVVVVEDDAVAEADAVGGAVAEGDALVVLGRGMVLTGLPTVKVARRTEVAPCAHFRTAVIVCRPGTSSWVSKGWAEPSLAVPAKSKGGTNSVRTGLPARRESSR